MNKFFRNILLLIIVLVLSYFTAEYFGALYDQFSYQYSNSFLGTERDLSIFIAGIPVAYVFFVIFIFKLFGAGNKKKWICWLLIPPFLFFVYGDLKHIYLLIILAAIAYGLSILLRKLLKLKFG